MQSGSPRSRRDFCTGGAPSKESRRRSARRCSARARTTTCSGSKGGDWGAYRGARPLERRNPASVAGSGQYRHGDSNGGAGPAVTRNPRRRARLTTAEPRSGPLGSAVVFHPPFTRSRWSLARRRHLRSRRTSRSSVVEAYFDGTERDFVLGTYSITEEGETTLDAPLAAYRVEDGEELPAR